MKGCSFTSSCTSQLKNYSQLGKSDWIVVLKESRHQGGSTKSIFTEGKKMHVLTVVEN